MTYYDYPTALELLGAALRSLADVPRLLAAVEVALAPHVPREQRTRLPCERHRQWHLMPIGLAEMDACAACSVAVSQVCSYCQCPHDEWPCQPYQAITAALLGVAGE